MAALREVKRYADLAADLRSSAIFPAEHTRTQSQSVANCILRSEHCLQLRLVLTGAIGEASIDLSTKGQA